MFEKSAYIKPGKKLQSLDKMITAVSDNERGPFYFQTRDEIRII
jgi:hypothetical protein